MSHVPESVLVLAVHLLRAATTEASTGYRGQKPSWATGSFAASRAAISSVKQCASMNRDFHSQERKLHVAESDVTMLFMSAQARFA